MKLATVGRPWAPGICLPLPPRRRDSRCAPSYWALSQLLTPAQQAFLPTEPYPQLRETQSAGLILALLVELLSLCPIKGLLNSSEKGRRQQKEKVKPIGSNKIQCELQWVTGSSEVAIFNIWLETGFWKMSSEDRFSKLSVKANHDLCEDTETVSWAMLSSLTSPSWCWGIWPPGE